MNINFSVHFISLHKFQNIYILLFHSFYYIINLLFMSFDKSFKENYFQRLQSNFNIKSKQRTPSPYFAFKPNNTSSFFHKSPHITPHNSKNSFMTANRSCQNSRKQTKTHENDVEYQMLQDLIKSQSKNINAFKAKIQKEKSKVSELFEIFKKQTNHFIQDAKLSFIAALDWNYKDYMEKYSLLNGLYRQLERQQYSRKNTNICSQCKSNNLVSFRNGSNYQSQASNYKSKLVDSIEILTLSQAPYYQRQKMQQTIKSISYQIDYNLKEIQTCLSEYIYSTDDVIYLKQNSQKKSHHEDLKWQLSQIKRRNQKIQKSNWQKTLSDKQSKCTLKSKNESKEINTSKFVNQNSYSTLNKVQNSKQCSNNFFENSIIKESKSITAEMKLETQFTIKTDHSEAVLCIAFIKNYIATGSKDHTVKIYDLKTMKQVVTLKNANSSICCLTTVNSLNGQLLGAGTDHGCSSVIFWNPYDWKVQYKKKLHDAAVSGIVDLLDGHIITGSYDKKIVVTNIIEQQHFHANSTHNSPITGLTIVKDKLVVSGLDNTLHIYIVVPNSKNSYTILFHQKIFVNHLICSMIPVTGLGYDGIACGMKDGYLEIFDAQTGNIRLSLKPQSNTILDMIAVPSNNSSKIITCTSSNRNSLSLINLFNDSVQNLQTNTQMHFQYGCGVGPMIAMNQKNKKLAILNQSDHNKSLTVFSLKNKSIQQE